MTDVHKKGLPMEDLFYVHRPGLTQSYALALLKRTRFRSGRTPLRKTQGRSSYSAPFSRFVSNLEPID